jgi:hypothetical protein
MMRTGSVDMVAAALSAQTKMLAPSAGARQMKMATARNVMSEYTVRIPSVAVPYGYVEVTASSLDEMPDPSELGAWYLNYWVKTGKAEVDAKSALEALEAAPKAAAAVPKGKRKVETVRLPEEPATATQDMTPEEAAKLISETLGATVMDESVYDTPVPEPVKPWQNKPDFDFDN